MTTPSQPNNELDKAIEAFELLKKVGAVHWSIECIEPLYLAAKRSKEFEKENEQLKSTIQLMEHGKYGRVDLIMQLDTLRTAYKQALEALEKAKQWIEVDSTEGCDCGVTEHCSYCSKATYTLSAVDSALSTLLAIATMKGEV